MFSGAVEESTLEQVEAHPSGTVLMVIFEKSIAYLNKSQDKDKPFNMSSSWRPLVAEYKAMCLSILWN
jgi:hypothetical protein